MLMLPLWHFICSKSVDLWPLRHIILHDYTSGFKHPPAPSVHWYRTKSGCPGGIWRNVVKAWRDLAASSSARPYIRLQLHERWRHLAALHQRKWSKRSLTNGVTPKTWLGNKHAGLWDDRVMKSDGGVLGGILMISTGLFWPAICRCYCTGHHQLTVDVQMPGSVTLHQPLELLTRL